MSDSKRPQAAGSSQAAKGPNRILGSLRDALAAASREETQTIPAPDAKTDRMVTQRAEPAAAPATPPPVPARPVAVAPPAPAPAAQSQAPAAAVPPTVPVPRAADAVREAKAPTHDPTREPHEPTTRVVRAGAQQAKREQTDRGERPEEGDRTQYVRGKPKVERASFHQDPVVGWLVVVGGPGLGSFRPVFEGNNTVGRSRTQRVPIDFGDDSISGEEQAYIRYDSMDRAFLFVPNLAKPNIVSVNSKKPTGAVELKAMDVITVGRTQLAFVPFCGEDFDWSELSDLKD
ncbi:MAG: FHA domain-containing protein [Hyphomicrobiaceae bacterium]